MRDTLAATSPALDSTPLAEKIARAQGHLDDLKFQRGPVAEYTGEERTKSIAVLQVYVDTLRMEYPAATSKEVKDFDRYWMNYQSLVEKRSGECIILDDVEDDDLALSLAKQEIFREVYKNLLADALAEQGASSTTARASAAEAGAASKPGTTPVAGAVA